MQFFWETVASNALLVVVLAAGVALLGRLWKNPLCLHLLWVFVLLKLVTPPAVTVPLPLPEKQTPPALEESAANPFAADPLRVEAPWQEKETASRMVHHEKQRFPADRPVAESPVSDLGNSAVDVPRQEISWLSFLGWIWGVGIILMASGQFYRVLRFRRFLGCGEVPPPTVLGMAEGIAKRLGLRRLPPIRMLPVCVSPLVWSLGVRPQVFLPAALFQRLDKAAQEAILTHELAHVKRNDHWIRLLEMLITTLFWWHPVVWWAARRLQELEDQCCDGIVVDLTPHSVKSYATALLDTLDFLSERSMAAPLGATAAKSSHSLARRITMLKNRSWTARWTFGRLMLLLTVAALPMAVAFGQKTAEPKAAEQTPEAKPLPPAPAGQPRSVDGKPLIQIDLTLVHVPRNLDLVKKLPNGGVILGEAEAKKLLEDYKDEVDFAPSLICPLGQDVCVKSQFRIVSVALCQVVPEAIRDNGAIALRIKPVVTASATLDDGIEKTETYPRPKDWPTSINAELKPGESVVLGGWDDARDTRDAVAVFVIQAHRYAETSADSPAPSAPKTSHAWRQAKSLSIPAELMKPVVGKNFVMVPMTTELQRAQGWKFANARLFVLINGNELFKEKNTVLNASAFDYEELHKAIKPFEARPDSTEGFIACVVSSRTPTPPDPETMSASSAFFSFLESQGWHYSIGPDNIIFHPNSDIDWPAVVAELSKPAAEEDIRLESGVGVGLVKAYPILTPLSRYLHKHGSENCVLRNMKPLDRLTPEEIKAYPEQAKACIAKLGLKETPAIRFLNDYGDSCSKGNRTHRLVHNDDDAWWKEQGYKVCGQTLWDGNRHGTSPMMVVKVVDAKGNLVQDVKLSADYTEETKNDLVPSNRNPPKFAKRGDGLWRSDCFMDNEDLILTVQSPGYKTHTENVNLPNDAVKEIEVRLEKE